MKFEGTLLTKRETITSQQSMQRLTGTSMTNWRCSQGTWLHYQ